MGGRSSMSRIGELLVRDQMITPTQLEEARKVSKASGGRLSNALAQLGYVDENKITEFLSKKYSVPAIDLREVEISKDILELVTKDVARKHHCIPVQRQGSSLVVAMSDPANIYAIDDLKFLTGYNISVVVASEGAIEDALSRLYDQMVFDAIFDDIDENAIEYDKSSDDNPNIVDLEKQSEDAPVVRLVNVILVNAVKKGASDIHIEPYEYTFRVRYRIDGVLHEEMAPPMKLKNAITSRIKIMSKLDIAERRLPQDGRIKIFLGKDQQMDYRVSVLPTIFGEKIVLRLLDKGNLQLDMTKLGFDPKPLADFKKQIHQPFGMVLVTGPTGSGKTTTLYSAMQDLNQPDTNISTAEDPVEYNLPGINQVNMHEDIGLTFAASLRSFLRQDPDIIMVGEIRDFETAEISVKAALTGHMVLSTLHTNDAPSTINRLLNMGVEPFLVSASVNLILAQRLARKICSGCAEPVTIPIETLMDLGMTESQAKEAKPMAGAGCRKCNSSGYKGRVALYEVMTMTENLKEMVLQGASTSEIKQGAIDEGMDTLRMAGLKKIAKGQTSPEEVTRVTTSD